MAISLHIRYDICHDIVTLLCYDGGFKCYIYIYIYLHLCLHLFIWQMCLSALIYN